MKKSILFLSIVFIFINAFSVQANANYFSGLEENSKLFTLTKSMKIESVESFLELTPKKIKAATGKKLKLKEIIALKIAQRKMKKQIKKSKPVSKDVYIILIVFGLGFIGVGLNSDWEGNDWLICFFLGFTCIGGIIYALSKRDDYY